MWKTKRHQLSHQFGFIYDPTFYSVIMNLDEHNLVTEIEPNAQEIW